MSVLIVDDSQDSRQLIATILKDVGYTKLLTAESAYDAFDQLGMNDPGVVVTGVDLILMDIDMPVIDGLEACRQIKAKPRLRDIPVIRVTGFTDVATLEAAFAAGAADYVPKTTTRNEMLVRVSTALETKREMDQRKLSYINELEAKNRELERAFSALGDKNQQLEEAFTELGVKNSQLEEASLAKTQILSTATHELRTPLTSIVGLSSNHLS